MNIHEYQGKEIFRRYDIRVPNGTACLSAADINSAVDAVNSDVWVVKAQIHAGGRGKGGGVKVVQDKAAAVAAANAMLGMCLVTHQTGAEGQTVHRLLIEEGANIADELYLSLVVDRVQQQVVLMASSEGGMDIEEVAATMPDKIHKMWIAPAAGVDTAAAEKLVQAIGIPPALQAEAVRMIENLYRLFVECDASLVEINPLVVTGSNELLALDAKINFDDSALFRHPEYEELRDGHEESAIEKAAAEHDLSYIALEGNIGCMVNGAGLAMATMDIIKLYGGEPANFLDVGGGATAEKVAAAFKLMLTNKELRAILINIFGGIMRCDIIAEGVTTAAQNVGLSVPLIVRLEGTNVEAGKQILADSGLAIIAADNMEDAAKKAVAAAKATQ
ncbi:MAG: ADP-forming succinate--CoA ligase subunit beta [Proteobacteria bacterium]|nr:ADP-forming succinate--CoA ligase subunit beta [Pseudomonadota bacterium]